MLKAPCNTPGTEARNRARACFATAQVDDGELHARNMHLLRVVRRLADDAEAKAGEHNASLTADDSAALQTAMEELEEMRAARRRQEEMVAAIVRNTLRSSVGDGV